MKIVKVHGIIFSIHILFIPIMFLLYFLGYGKIMIILLIIIILHELSHGLIAMFFGIKIKELEILPFGGVVKLDKSLNFTNREEIFISAAGPIFNLVISATVFFFQKYFGLKNSNVDFIIFSNLIIGIFNLIPVLPLDGGRIVRSLLSYLFGYKNATRIIVIFSKLFAFFLIGINIFIFSLESYNITFILLGIFIYIKSNKEQKMTAYITMRDFASKKESLNKQGSMESQHMTVLPETTLGEISRQFTPKKFYIIYVLNEHYALKGILTEDEILSAILEYGMHGKVKNILEKRNNY
ncbi:M50 family metallopeptidase [Garciella nitratireducens]|uniref:Stage IV sporulation protein FB n=1 Tax=Garciella nitratireducens DSM 15102 TaxID=1121911 RepID=A0A1T4K992_9FIRM|nr:M50 family metallopeptidase [Garciella nitratireducens]SJZ38875.1 stage IV sporulation protein FB [Garciella nitratireducens DSM 15102]